MKKVLLLSLIAAVMNSCSCPTNTPEIQEKKWWKEAIVYQIYPRSFKDTDGDGVGDLKGIIEELDYIKSLGVTAVWLNPIYESPNFDNGYDVSDYQAISKEFGSMDDFDLMLDEMHKRGIKLVMDIVVNHSSSEHPWFKASRSSRDSEYRDYYHWWPAEKGKPNHRYSLFDDRGDAWKYDSITDAYYLHYFAQQQPDLNWSNPKVQQEVNGILDFWAAKGVDGFRLDAFQFAAKDTSFPELPDDLDTNFIQYYAMQEGIHDYLRSMNTEVFSKYDVMSVAEGAGRNFQEAHDLVDADRNELSMAYAFDAVDLPRRKDYSTTLLKEVFTNWDKEFSEKGWISIFLSNHDQARLVSRFGNDSEEFRVVSTKLLNTFMLSMRGTPYLYYGDELGMTNIYFNSIEQYDDISTINTYKKIQSDGGDTDAYLVEASKFSRDNGRTPMQWNASEQAGFTTGSPWLPVNDNKSLINVEAENEDADSVLNHLRAMTAIRSAHNSLIYGEYKLIETEEDLYVFERSFDGEQLLVVLNFSQEPKEFDLSNYKISEVLIDNYKDTNINSNTLDLQPYQALVLKFK